MKSNTWFVKAIDVAIKQGGYRKSSRYNGKGKGQPLGDYTIVQDDSTIDNQRLDLRYQSFFEWITFSAVVLDPRFWQALGKALGWGTTQHDVLEYETKFAKRKTYTLTPSWQYYAHQYFALVLIDGNTEKFWKELLS